MFSSQCSASELLFGDSVKLIEKANAMVFNSDSVLVLLYI